MAATISMGSLASERLSSAAAPEKLVTTLSGNPICRSVFAMAFKACPSEKPGARLKDRITEGNRFRRVIERGVVSVSEPANALNGTWSPDLELTWIDERFE